jgi:hypothetical protein
MIRTVGNKLATKPELTMLWLVAKSIMKLLREKGSTMPRHHAMTKKTKKKKIKRAKKKRTRRRERAK